MFTDQETDRLLLKNISRDDRNFILAQFSDAVVSRYLFDAEPLTDIGGADDIIDFYLTNQPQTAHRWIILRKTDGIKMGTCGFHIWNQSAGTVEVGYDLQQPYWGHGYMQEAMSSIIAFARDNMVVHRIDACIYPENHASIALATRLGFVFSGQTKVETFRNQPYLHHIYSLTL